MPLALTGLYVSVLTEASNKHCNTIFFTINWSFLHVACVVHRLMQLHCIRCSVKGTTLAFRLEMIAILWLLQSPFRFALKPGAL